MNDEPSLRFERFGRRPNVFPFPEVFIRQVHTDPDSPDGFFLLIVPGSQMALHAVKVNEGFRYPIRDGRQTRYLAESEVAAAYRNRFALAVDEAISSIVIAADDVHVARWYRDLPVWIVQEDLAVEHTPRKLLQVSFIRRAGEELVTGSVRFRRREGDFVLESDYIPEEHIRRVDVNKARNEVPDALRELWEQQPVAAKENVVEVAMLWDELEDLRARLIS